MRLKYLPAFIMLTAGAIVSIIDIMHKLPLHVALKRLLLVLIIFYIIGLIAKAIIENTLQDEPQLMQEEDEENSDEEIVNTEAKQ
ncbi:MAG: hypothetical protein GX359_05345 [Clostridiales bacterium]|nr:hypothetical protein [Clostridiales bacterium]